MRWTGQGQTSLSFCDVYYSGHASRHEFGCGFAVRYDLRNLVSRFTAVDERLAAIRIKAKYFYISIICAHASTEDKDDTTKDAFYNKLDQFAILTQKWEQKVFLGQQSENTVCTRKQATMTGILRCRTKHGCL